MIFLNDSEKKNIQVGFSPYDFKKHQGRVGLKYYLIIMYLRMHIDVFGEVRLTLDSLAAGCGYKSSSRNNDYCADFREILQVEIIGKRFANTDKDILKAKTTEMITLKFSEEKSPFYVNGSFVSLSVEEFEKILASDSKTKKANLIGVYLYIKHLIWKNGGFSSPDRAKMMDDLGIGSKNTIDSAITALEDAKMLFVAREMYIENEKSPGTYVPIRNVYALEGDALLDEVLLPHLEKLYMKPIYKKDDVPGKIVYLPRRKE